MSEKELSSSIDAALAHVDPDRRKFLGILLAGVAAAPLLTSASLAAQDATGAHFPKNATTVKGNTTIKEGKFNTIKMNDQKTQNIKYWDKTSGSNAQIKGENSQIKLDSSRTIKGETKPPKSETTAIKGETSPIKGETTAIKGETKPVQH